MATKMTEQFYNKLVSKILLQAAKDYINPDPVIRYLVLKLNKNDKDYMEQVDEIRNSYRRGVLRDLRSKDMELLSDGRSLVIANKLEQANLILLKQKIEEEEKRIELEEQVSTHKFDYKVESIV